MSDLISKIDVLKLIDNITHVNYKDSDVYYIRQKILEMPTAFDTDDVIAELEQERDNCYEQMKRIEEKGENETDYFDGHIFDEYHNQGIGLNKSIDIINKYLSETEKPPKTD